MGGKERRVRGIKSDRERIRTEAEIFHETAKREKKERKRSEAQGRRAEKSLGGNGLLLESVLHNVT